MRRYEVKILFEEIVNAWGDEPSQNPEIEATAETLEDAGDGDLQSASQRMRKMRKKRFISLLDVMERYQRHGFFTSPGDLIPNFF